VAGRNDPHCAISAPIVLPQVKVKMTRCEGGRGGLPVTPGRDLGDS
jgi:hypothetical protein